MGETNRQVANTEPMARMCSASDFAVSIDWLEFTVCGLSLAAVVEDILGLSMEQIIHTGSGNYGYTDKYVFLQSKHVVLLAGGTEQQGIHVQLSGQGCASLFQYIAASTLIYAVLSHGGHFTRIDLALDDKACAWYSVPQLVRYVQKKEIVSHWREVTIDFGLTLHDSTVNKQILYLGSARSDFSLRIYNKTLEQRKHLLDKEAIAALPEQWVRWEFTCRRKKAQALVQLLVEREYALGEIFADLLSGNMRIVRSDGSDSNRSRWPMRAKWEKLIGEARPLRLSVPAVEPGIKEKTKWLQKQVIPTVAGLMQTKDGMARFFEMLAEGHYQVKAPMWKMVANYNEMVQDNTDVRNVVKHHYVPYVTELIDRFFLEGPVENKERPWAVPV